MVKLRGNLTDKMEANPGKVHFRRWKAMSIGSRISLVVLILIVMIAVFANILAPHNPLEIFTARQAPDAQFLFGTDDKGRDVLSRMMYGARYSLIIGLGATAFALVCGSIIGAVAAVARNFLGNYLYMSESAYLEAFGDRAAALDDDENFEPNGVLVRCTAGDETSLADELSDDTRFLSVTSTSELADDFSQSFMLINAVVAIVLGMAAALAFAVLFTLSTTNISERERELATIKVLGFRPREVHHYVNKETIILTLIGIVCGLPFGYVLGDMLLHVLKMPQISFLTTVTPISYVLAAILPLVFALIVNLITNRTLNRIDMIEALKSVE